MAVRFHPAAGAGARFEIPAETSTVLFLLAASWCHPDMNLLKAFDMRPAVARSDLVSSAALSDSDTEIAFEIAHILPALHTAEIATNVH